MNRRRLPNWLSEEENNKSTEKKIQNDEKKSKCEGVDEIQFSSTSSSTKINDNIINITTTKTNTKITTDKRNKNIISEESMNSTVTSMINCESNKLIQPEKLIANIKLNETNPSGRTLRSHSRQIDSKKEPELKPSQYPFIEYKGKIEYLTDMIGIACVSDEITKWVELQEKNIVPIGFDMEWSFSFNTGQGKTALIQICAEENMCYLFHVFHLKKLPAALVALLGHKKVQLHGVNIKNDLRKLQRDFPDVNVERMILQCLDLGTWCNTVCDTGGRWSLERLVLYICKLRINKDKKVRMSKWHVIPLTDEQKTYAAIDVYISQVIYKKLEKRLQEKEKSSQEFVETFGESALKAVQELGVDFTDF